MKGFGSICNLNEEIMVKGNSEQEIREKLEFWAMKFDAFEEFAYAAYDAPFSPAIFARRGLVSDIIAEKATI
jgi:hypothetical protein